MCLPGARGWSYSGSSYVRNTSAETTYRGSTATKRTDPLEVTALHLFQRADAAVHQPAQAQLHGLQTGVRAVQDYLWSTLACGTA